MAQLCAAIHLQLLYDIVEFTRLVYIYVVVKYHVSNNAFCTGKHLHQQRTNSKQSQQ